MTVLFSFFVLGSLLVAGIVSLVVTSQWRPSGMTVFLIVGSAIAIVRVGAYCYLMYLELTNQQTLSALPLVFLLYPEGLLVPNDRPWTVGNGIAFASALAAGSFMIGAIAGGLTAIQRKLRTPRSTESDTVADR